MIPRQLKRLAGAVIVLASLAFLVYYWRSHPEIASQLRTVSPAAILALLGLYLVMTLLLVLIYDTILRLCGAPIPLGEHTLLTIYSSIINFFGPLQSGPGFRTVYLKRRHGVPVRAYVSATLLYYAIFGICNLAFLAAGASSLAYLPLLAVVLAAGAAAGRFLAGRVRLLNRFQGIMTSPLLGRLAVLTFLQAALVVAIYGIELHTIGTPASPRQVVAYAGAGSLALYVSLTPGALGFRESFQYFAQSIHHISSTSIIAANVLDRSIYVVFLGLLFLVALIFHARQRFAPHPSAGRQPPQTGGQPESHPPVASPNRRNHLQ